MEEVVNSNDSFADLLRRFTHIYIDSVARDPDYLRMEMQSALEGSAATQQFFENRWRPFTDFIEYSLKELAANRQVAPVNSRVASLMFQGMIREALYTKCISRSQRYRDFELQDLAEHMVGLFLSAIEYREQSA